MDAPKSEKVRNFSLSMEGIPANNGPQDFSGKSQDAFRHLVDRANDAIVVVGSDERIIYLNEFAKRLIEMKPDLDWSDKKLSDWIAPEQYGRVADILHRRVAGDVTPNKYETKMLTEKGRTVPIEITSSRSVWNGETVSFSIVRDVTIHKKFEDEYYRVEDQYQDLTESRFDLFFRFQPDTTLTYVSKGTVEYFQQEEVELLGTKWLQLIAPQIRLKVAKKLAELQNDPRQTKIVIPFSGGDLVRYFECVMTPLFTRTGKLIEFQASARDITKIRELRETFDHYEALVKNAMDFIPGVSVCGYYRDGNVFYWNKASEEMYGFAADEAIGKKLDHLIIPPAAAQRFRLTLDAAKNITGSGEFEMPEEQLLRRKDGTMVPVYSIHTAVTRGDADPLLFRIDIDLTEKRQYEEVIKKRLVFQNTITKISSRFATTADLDVAIDESLEDIGRLCEADRSYLFVFQDRGRFMTNTHEWCAAGVSPQKQNLQYVETAENPWFISQIEPGQHYHIKDVTQLPPEAAAERKRYRDQNIRSLLIFPFSIQGDLAGFIGLDNTRQVSDWQEEDLMLLGVVAEVLAGALERKHLEEKRKDALLKMQEAYQHLGVINRQISILLSVGRQEKKREAKKIADFLVDSALVLSQALCGALYLYDSEAAEFNLLGKHYSDGIDPQMPQLLRLEDHFFLQELIRTGERVQMSSTKKDLGFFANEESVQLKLIVALPIVKKAKILGLLTIGYDKRQSISPLEVNFLEAFAMQASALLQDVINGNSDHRQ